MDEILADLGDFTAPEPPWFPAFVAAGLERLERRLADERILDAIDESRAFGRELLLDLGD